MKNVKNLNMQHFSIAYSSLVVGFCFIIELRLLLVIILKKYAKQVHHSIILVSVKLEISSVNIKSHHNLYKNLRKGKKK